MSFTSILVSGLPGSGKSTLIKRLSGIYGWPVYGIGKIWRDEWARKYPNAEKSFEEFWRSTSLEDNTRVNQIAKEIFAKGEVIGDTRYTAFCADLPALLVFVTCPLDIRAARAPKERYPDKNPEEIKAILQQRDLDELKMGKDIFGQDYDYRDPNNHHLVLNSGKLKIEEEVASILSMYE